VDEARNPLMASRLIAILQKQIKQHGDKPVILEDLDTSWFFDIDFDGLTHSEKNYKISAQGGYGDELKDGEI
jgi:hypothetical protein